uniref:Condensin complex subunit 2 n=1 Tax=Skeletonema marinoi TaxID=267567 RepID=A0A6T5SRU4_9STRA
MSKLDSAYDIDPLFHKMSKAFDEGGAKGLLLGNLGVAQNGCHIVFDSKENEEEVNETEANEDESNDEEEKTEQDDDDDDKKMEEFGIDPEEAVVWKESEIDITSFAAKLETMLASYGAQTSASVPFVPQLESLREDYVTLERDGYAVEGNDSMSKDGRKRLRLYDAPEEEEKEAERSIHVIATERSRASILGTSMLGMSFGLSMDMGDGEDDNVGGGAIDFNAEDLGGEGEFAPADDGSFGGGGEGEFAPDFGSSVGSASGGFGDARSYNNTKTLLDALCDADAFYEGSDYAFFDVKKFEKATDGNLWAGSQHWKKGSGMAKKNTKKADEKKKVMFENDDEEEGPKKRKKAVKKDRVFVDFNAEPDVDAIFQKKKTTRKTKKAPKDPFQMAKTEKDFLLPPDANVDITQLTRLFSRPNAVVRRTNDADNNNNKPIGKTVGFYDVEDNALGFNDNDDADFGGDDAGDGGFNFAYDDEADEPESNDVDYNTENFDEVRKVEKIDINYAQVAKKVDVRRLKKDLWTELEEKTAWIKPEEFSEKADEEKEEEDDDDDMYEDPRPKTGEPQYVSFKETCEKLDNTQGQHGVTVSFYFICCLHLANEKGLKFESDGNLEDFMISLDDGSAPTFGTFGDGFTETVDKLKSRGINRDKKVASYAEEE